MDGALRRHNNEKHKHDPTGCNIAGCLCCHSEKVFKRPNRQKKRQLAKEKFELNEISIQEGEDETSDGGGFD
jgi:hypothetical protein